MREVLMRVGRVIQEAGRDRPLDAGRVYALPAPLASAFLASGDAVLVDRAVTTTAMDGSPLVVAATARRRRR